MPVYNNICVYIGKHFSQLLRRRVRCVIDILSVFVHAIVHHSNGLSVYAEIAAQGKTLQKGRGGFGKLSVFPTMMLHFRVVHAFRIWEIRRHADGEVSVMVSLHGSKIGKSIIRRTVCSG